MEITITDNGTYICKAGDILHVRGQAAPVIKLSGGKVCTYNTSAPLIKLSGGEVRTCDSSTPVIT